MSTPAGMIPGQTMPGQQGQQGHPTVGNAGLPGAPVTVLPSGNGQSQQQQSQQFQQANVQHVQQQGYPVGNLPPAPQQNQGTFNGQQGQQPQYPGVQGMQQQFQPSNQNQPPQGYQQPQQQPSQVQLQDDAILDGPGVPPELRGRKWGQVKSIYNGLRQGYLQQPAMQNQQQAPQTQQQPQGQQQPNVQSQRQQQRPWQDEIRDIVSEQLRPIQQQTTSTAVERAIDNARQTIPDWNDLEGDVLAGLQGVDPSMLANPTTWVRAADLIRGEKMRTGQYQGQQNQVQPQQSYPIVNYQGGQYFQTPQGLVAVQQQQQGYQQGDGQRAVPAQQVQFQQPTVQNPVPQHQFFTEGPSAPNVQQPMNMISATEREYARRMNMSPEDYVAWRGGVVR